MTFIEMVENLRTNREYGMSVYKNTWWKLNRPRRSMGHRLKIFMRQWKSDLKHPKTP